MPTVLVALPLTSATHAVWNGLRNELEEEYDVVTLVTTNKTSTAEMATAIAATDPSCIVLLNNTTVGLYRNYQRTQPLGAHFPPSVILMTSFLFDLSHLVENATGVAYEVPAVTSFIKLRSLLLKPISKVGVIYRPQFRSMVSAQVRLAAIEKLSIVGIEVPRSPTPEQLGKALKTLREEHGIDALWVLNDNRLLGSPELFVNGWLAGMNKAEIPIVVGVGALVSSKIHFGSFAMLPDHDALGVQAADLIFELADDSWDVRRHPVQLPLSTKTVIDLQQSQTYLRLREGALSRIDRVAK